MSERRRLGRRVTVEVRRILFHVKGKPVSYRSHCTGALLYYWNTRIWSYSFLYLHILSESPHPGGIWKCRWPLIKELNSVSNLRICHLCEGSPFHLVVGMSWWPHAFGVGGLTSAPVFSLRIQFASPKTFSEHSGSKLLCDASIFLPFCWNFLNVVSKIGLSLGHCHFSVILDF